MALVLVALLTGCGATTPNPADEILVPRDESRAKVTAEVSIESTTFVPYGARIRAGEAVRWTNRDAKAHNVGGAGLASGLLEPGESFTRTFTEPGTYQYLCTLHPDDRGGFVEVLPKGDTSTD